MAYADFVTALMAFFLLLWILTQVPKEKRSEMAVYFMDPGGYNSRVTRIDLTNPPPSAPSDTDQLTSAELNYLAIHHFLSELLHEQLVDNKTKLTPSEAGVLLRTSSALTFAENAVDLGPEGEKVLMAVVEVMRRFKVNLMVGGHTDSMETGQPRLRNKWELSAARAAFATSFIVERGGVDPSHIMTSAYAGYRPIIPETAGVPTPANRRVEFFFYTPDTKPANLGFQ